MQCALSILFHAFSYTTEHELWIQAMRTPEAIERIQFNLRQDDISNMLHHNRKYALQLDYDLNSSIFISS